MIGSGTRSFIANALAPARVRTGVPRPNTLFNGPPDGSSSKCSGGLLVGGAQRVGDHDPLDSRRCPRRGCTAWRLGTTSRRDGRSMLYPSPTPASICRSSNCVGDQERDALVVDDRRAERLPLLGVGGHVFQCGPCDPECLRGDHRPRLFQRAQRRRAGTSATLDRFTRPGRSPTAPAPASRSPNQCPRSPKRPPP